jgi:hypothetical protein
MGRAIAVRVHRGANVETMTFERENVKIGRLPSMHLRLDDPKVSRIHAVIDIGANEVAIIDMVGTAEGIRVNGERAANSRTRLRHGDEVIIGDSRLVMVLDPAEVAAISGGAVVAMEHAPISPSSGVNTSSGVFASGSTDLEALRNELNRTVSQPVTSADVFSAATMPPSAAVLPPVDLPVMLTPTPLSVSHQAPVTNPGSFAAISIPPESVPPRSAVVMSAPVMRAPLPRTQSPSILPSLPPIQDDAITPANRYVEVSLRWMNTVTDVRRVRDVPRFRIGNGVVSKPGDKTGDGVDMFVPLEDGDDKLDLLTAQNGSWSVNFTPSMGGTITRGGHTVPLSSAGGYNVPLTDDTLVQLSVGPFTLEVQPVSKSRAVPVVPFFDTLWANTLVTSVFAGVAMLAVLTLVPVGMDNLDDDLLTNPTKFQTLILKPPPKDNSFLKKLNGPKQQTAAAKNAEGKAGSKKADPNKDKGKMAAKVDKPTNEEVVQSKLDALFGDKGKGGIASLFDNDAKGGALEAALGNIDGASVAAGYGEGGVGFRGGGPGGGGSGTNTFGTGKVGTLGRGAGNGSYGASDGGLGKRDDRDVTMTQGTPQVIGSLDPEIIRRIVREHAGQIKYCYEKELIRTPGISGKVIMKWVINGEGKVTQALSQESQLKNPAVESCLANRIKTWVFPKPKGGGTVVVNYPFVFKQGGG